MTKTTVLSKEEVRLTELGSLISKEHEAMRQYARRTLESARQIGEYLIEVRDAIQWGGWGKWLEANVDFTDRTARFYIQLAEGWPQIEQAYKSESISELTFTDALKFLSQPKLAKEELKRATRPLAKYSIIRTDLIARAAKYNPAFRHLKAVATAMRTKYEEADKARSEGDMKAARLANKQARRIMGFASQRDRDQSPSELIATAKSLLESQALDSWRFDTDVKEILNAVKHMTKRLLEWKRAYESGKFSPEAGPFAARKVRLLTESLSELADIMNSPTELSESMDSSDGKPPDLGS